MALYPTTSSPASTAFIHGSLAALEQQDHTINPTIDDTKEQPCRITTSTPDSSASSLCSSSSSECSLEMNINNNNCLEEASSNQQENGHNNEQQQVSGGSRHECSTPPLLPTTADAAALCWEVLLYSYCSQWLLPPLVKDDVFLGPPINDNESVMTASSSASSIIASNKNPAPTPSPPCLSPVSAPAEFLWNHEPLFDGIDDLQHQQPPSDNENKNNGSSSSSSSTPPPPSIPTPSTMDDDISMPSPSSICEADDISFFDDDEEENNNNVPRLSLKRQRSENEASPSPTPPPRKSTRSNKPTPSHQATTTSKRRTKRYAGRRSRSKPIKVIAPYHEPQDGDEYLTVFERLTQAGIDWCRYCGTTEGVNWRPGPWGKRTLCNKHGCDYKGYGIASRLPRLDLSAFANEHLEERKRPVVQQFCIVCHSPESVVGNKLVACEGGCSRAYHQHCRIPSIPNTACHDQQWCCSTLCRENRKRNKVGPYDA
ncbi:hypothetical protein O0I10_002868 [Lichtheimia ornata]|uniref:PHD-type domain-containing protein n=1 Tax=Lichtheimia ornata TaxID=688661 RepID=A0AAD7V9X1_9FUNG|nr:uncharacterized protein O0I10_002868 [Lichtheimia ornata]KAJ8661600.1 hypothetical protein O0I10_002868 [Lichtheimia ornata]